jgi:hypothetical protein
MDPAVLAALTLPSAASETWGDFSMAPRLPSEGPNLGEYPEKPAWLDTFTQDSPSIDLHHHVGNGRRDNHVVRSDVSRSYNSENSQHLLLVIDFHFLDSFDHQIPVR